MGKAKQGMRSKFRMESCDDGCKAKLHCASILRIAENEPGLEFRCPIISVR